MRGRHDPIRDASRARAALGARLERRREEIEQAILSRVHAIADPAEVTDPIYADGLRSAIAAALEYGLRVIERSEENAPLPPPILLAQARLAARSGVGLDTVLRRYFAGYAVLGHFLSQEHEAAGAPPGIDPAQVMADRAAVFDRLIAAASEEYAREADVRGQSPQKRQAERVRRLLAGEKLDTSDLAYDLESSHLAAIIVAPGAGHIARELSSELDSQLLSVSVDEETVWAWLGARRLLDPGDAESFLAAIDGNRLTAAVGEPGTALAGWRISHRQAAAALPVAMRRGKSVIRYADVALLASALQDRLLASSLHRLYVEPLERDLDEGETARQTLRAYFRSGRNASSAAAALGLNRRTVASRLKSIEGRIGSTIEDALPDIEVALWIDELEGAGS